MTSGLVLVIQLIIRHVQEVANLLQNGHRVTLFNGVLADVHLQAEV